MKTPSRLLCLAALFAFCVTVPSSALGQGKGWITKSPLPEWIWAAGKASSGQRVYFRKTIQIAGDVTTAELYASCDNEMVLWINGKKVASSVAWERAVQTDVTKLLRAGENVIAVEGKNHGGIAGLVLKMMYKSTGSGKTAPLVTNGTWKLSTAAPVGDWKAAGFDDASWTTKVQSHGTLGKDPWGVPGVSRGGGKVTPSDEIHVPDGFAVDLIYNVPKGEQGSWVALTRGPGGSLIACDQGDKGLFQITVQESTGGPDVDVQSMGIMMPDGKRSLSGAQGLLHAFGALWFHKNGDHLYRIKDSTGDGAFDSAEKIPSGRGGGEHGNHALIVTEDGEGIYMCGGNHAPLHDVSRQRVPSWNEDLLLSRMWDARGHARGKLAPGGWVTRLDPETLEQELVCIGFRNEYDIALNRHGDMFTYDADMEWDLGSPWYRPTRICHVVSGGDYGWRSGTGKWPTYYEDSLPPSIEIGPGSPTGVVAGTGAKFPAKYQDAIFALDWTFGTIYACHMTPQGAGYVGESEPFVTGSPLPVTDAVVGADGLLYFTVGGRGTQSGLYRVRYVGNESTEPLGASDLPPAIAKAKQIRRKLETFHGREDATAIDTAWPHLSSDDRFLRAAARVAIESQPVTLWAEAALRETNPQAKITAAVALARSGTEDFQSSLIQSLTAMDFASLKVEQKLGVLRAYALSFVRMGRPAKSLRDAVIAQIDSQLPCDNADLNTELARVLIYLQSPGVVGKVMGLINGRGKPEIPDWTELASRNAGYGGTVNRMMANHPPSREIQYALMLRETRNGWTPEYRRQYFEFINAASQASGGMSYPGFLTNIRNEALANCSNVDRAAVADITGENFDPVPDFEIQKIEGPGQAWTVEAAIAGGGKDFKKADFTRGRSLYFAASCGKCHRFSGLGGGVGPDLTSIPNKFDVRYVIEHIIDPSKVISDQYQSSVVITADGRTLNGLAVEEKDRVTVYPPDANAKPIVVDIDDVDEIRPSAVSQMPKGLLDSMNATELRDLIAYLMSGGDPKSKKVYGK